MMTRITLAFLTAGFLATTACAAEQKQEAEAVSAPVKVVAVDPNLPATTDADWREPDPENTLYIKTAYGVFVVEMAPEFAPKHVKQVKTLARQGFYNDITFHRVIKGFMNQTGDPRGDGTGDSSLPDIPKEFTFRRSPSDMKIKNLGRVLSPKGEVETGFYKAFPIASKPGAQAFMTKDGKVDAWALHCPSITSMARGGGDENSANSQFFLMRGAYPSLNTKYSIWGTTIWGRKDLKKIKIGVAGEDKRFVPDILESVRVASDIPEAERINVQILRTDGAAFGKYLEALKGSSGKYPEICDIQVPTRLKS
ncbi:MAG: peptidylprolyl isomerase [Robiginitomaculum sp.]|nr:peptidylprolyl isomerase [Robiginitomaculum sp.]